jgi:hypothetical protein
MKRLINKIKDWWWNNIGFRYHMYKEKKRIMKNTIVNIYTDVD